MIELSLCHSHCRTRLSTLSVYLAAFSWQEKRNLPHTFSFKRSDRMSFGFIFHRKITLLYFFQQTRNSFCVLLFLHACVPNTVIVSFCAKTFILLCGLGVCLFFSFFSENVFDKRIKLSFSDKQDISCSSKCSSFCGPLPSQ